MTVINGRRYIYLQNNCTPASCCTGLLLLLFVVVCLLLLFIVVFVVVVFFFQEYLTSEGLLLNEKSQKPDDPYILSRYRPPHAYVTPSDFDKLKQFLELDRKVLRFYCVWDDRDSMFGEMRQEVILPWQMIFMLENNKTILCADFAVLSGR